LFSSPYKGISTINHQGTSEIVVYKNQSITKVFLECCGEEKEKKFLLANKKYIYLSFFHEKDKKLYISNFVSLNKFILI
jgi:hypothetical protein